MLLALTMSALGAGAALAAADDGRGLSPVVAAGHAGKMKGAINETTAEGWKVKGSFTPSSFTVQDGALMVTGTAKGFVKDKGAPKFFEEEVTTTVEGVSTGAMSGGGRMAPSSSHLSCDILNLVLGPLDLNVLGLEVHLQQVVLDIIAVPGALLGDLLCAVANLLSTGPLEGLLVQLQALLTQILGQLSL